MAFYKVPSGSGGLSYGGKWYAAKAGVIEINDQHDAATLAAHGYEQVTAPVEVAPVEVAPAKGKKAA